MATDLFIIAKIKTSKEEVMSQKDIWLQQLKDLKLEHLFVFGHGQLTGDWEFEFPTTYDDVTDSIIPDVEDPELIYYSSPFVFSIGIYEDCLILSTIYKYSFLYEKGNFSSDYLFVFRTKILKILKIFNAEHEIIYLADNGCDKLSRFLELQVWEGVGYDGVKQNMINSGIPFTKDYLSLDYDKLDYSNIFEFVYDDFDDIKHPEIFNHPEFANRMKDYIKTKSFSKDILETRKDKNIALIYAVRAFELLEKEQEQAPKFRYFYDYKSMSNLFLDLDNLEYVKKCDENWLYHQDIYKFKPSDFCDYLGKLIEKEYSNYLLEIFENQEFRKVFNAYYDVVIKLFFEENRPLDSTSSTIYKNIKKGTFEYLHYFEFRLL